jgi:protein-tyrosine-phosphatase
MPSILFVCTANRLRSPLAAAMLKKKLGELRIAESWQIDSAGIWATAGQTALPEVVKAAAKIGIDLSSHRSAQVSRELLFDYDLIVAVAAGQKEALLTEFPQLQDSVYLLSDIVERRSYDIPDAPSSEQELKEIIVELDSLIRRGLQSICVLATYLYNTKRNNSQREG